MGGFNWGQAFNIKHATLKGFPSPKWSGLRSADSTAFLCTKKKKEIKKEKNIIKTSKTTRRSSRRLTHTIDNQTDKRGPRIKTSGETLHVKPAGGGLTLNRDPKQVKTGF